MPAASPLSSPSPPFALLSSLTFMIPLSFRLHYNTTARSREAQLPYLGHTLYCKFHFIIFPGDRGPVHFGQLLHKSHLLPINHGLVFTMPIFGRQFSRNAFPRPHCLFRTRVGGAAYCVRTGLLKGEGFLRLFSFSLSPLSPFPSLSSLSFSLSPLFRLPFIHLFGSKVKHDG